MIYAHHRFRAINDKYVQDSVQQANSDECSYQDVSKESSRSNLGNGEVSRYLRLDLVLPTTKKAVRETLKEHPLAAPRKCTRSDRSSKNGKSRKLSPGPEFGVFMSREGEATTSTGSSSKHDEANPEDEDSTDVGLEPLKSGCIPSLELDDDFMDDISTLDMDIDSEIDDEDLLRLDDGLAQSPVHHNAQIQEAHDRYALPTPPASDLPVPKSSPAKPIIHSIDDSVQDDWLFDDDDDMQLDEIDLSAIAELPRDSPLIPQPRQPIQRASFPAEVSSHSPITGLSAESFLRTCFRIGEALNVGCNAVRRNQNVLLELFARVSSSRMAPEESSPRQHFELVDLFHDNPPLMNAVFELSGKRVLDNDARDLLGADVASPSLCRCVGSMTRVDCKWVLAILSIRRVDWEEVEYVAGIYGT